MKKRWVEPRVQVEEFMPNEYVAVCYSVVCNTGAANKVEMGWHIKKNDQWTNNYDAGQIHDPSRCGALGSYYVRDDDGNGLMDSLTEYSPDQGPLACTLYTNASYNQMAGWNTVSASSGTIYWETNSADGTRTWHHQGVVQVADASHPNRS